ncbi:hypothetical protein BU24DRAFT_414902 [Aaosphaeria arxii CBS 175.79]|uniref:Uncharacterized protein n=1 Tax=Aaosphaeria arxii CBS 175.79 TaxID=1450172 RepID=A0A6A5XA07_9PLEO|nr:uncharacterized protein BU24DRAFT_414902 [Aaosphaeria arxii CBS 175.79]KAF2009594.1 hypothetical protein BU24DRAFT_414902 [Aaosphaeria arxii CBS 175.79]
MLKSTAFVSTSRIPVRKSQRLSLPVRVPNQSATPTPVKAAVIQDNTMTSLSGSTLTARQAARNSRLRPWAAPRVTGGSAPKPTTSTTSLPQQAGATSPKSKSVNDQKHTMSKQAVSRQATTVAPKSMPAKGKEEMKKHAMSKQAVPRQATTAAPKSVQLKVNDKKEEELRGNGSRRRMDTRTKGGKVGGTVEKKSVKLPGATARATPSRSARSARATHRSIPERPRSPPPTRPDPPTSSRAGRLIGPDALFPSNVDGTKACKKVRFCNQPTVHEVGYYLTKPDPNQPMPKVMPARKSRGCKRMMQATRNESGEVATITLDDKFLTRIKQVRGYLARQESAVGIQPSYGNDNFVVDLSPDTIRSSNIVKVNLETRMSQSLDFKVPFIPAEAGVAGEQEGYGVFGPCQFKAEWIETDEEDILDDLLLPDDDDSDDGEGAPGPCLLKAEWIETEEDVLDGLELPDDDDDDDEDDDDDAVVGTDEGVSGPCLLKAEWIETTEDNTLDGLELPELDSDNDTPESSDIEEEAGAEMDAAPKAPFKDQWIETAKDKTLDGLDFALFDGDIWISPSREKLYSEIINDPRFCHASMAVYRDLGVCPELGIWYQHWFHTTTWRIGGLYDYRHTGRLSDYTLDDFTTSRLHDFTTSIAIRPCDFTDWATPQRHYPGMDTIIGAKHNLCKSYNILIFKEH